MEERKIKRPIVVITLGAIFGIICGLNFKNSILIFICIILLIYIDSQSFHKSRGDLWSPALRSPSKRCVRYLKIIFNKKIIITFTISAMIFNAYTIILNKQYENFYEKVEENIEIEAVVISSCKDSEYYTSYTLKGKNEEFKNKKFILYVKKGTNLEYGDKIKITGKFYEPEDSRNYKGFSYKKYLQTQKIYGTIKAESVELKSKNNTASILKLSNTVRNKIVEQIKNILPEETSGLLIGLMLGDKTYISDELKTDFQKSSLAHILAVSGAHVSYIILGLTYLVTINKIPKKSGYIFIMGVLIAFIFITNFSVSVVRACTMSIIFIISKLFYRKADIKNTIAISALIILIFNPYSINSVSMQLSYLGTLGVIFIAPMINNKISKIISAPIAAQIAISPIMIKNFNTISFTFLISNLIAMPLLGICIIGGYLLTLFSFIWIGLAKKIGIIFNLILKTLILIAKVCGNLKLSNIYVITPNAITIVIYYIIVFTGIYVFIYRKKIAARKGSTFLTNTWSKKMSYPDEMRRKNKKKYGKNSNNCCNSNNYN